jgi:hypothetical protein
VKYLAARLICLKEVMAMLKLHNLGLSAAPTPSEQAKAAGLESLAQVVRISGVSQRTLINWHKHKPQLFAVVLAGCATHNKP